MKKLILIFLLLAVIKIGASAYDIYDNGLRFDINEDGESVTLVSVNRELDELIIPETVTDSGKSYTVTAIKDMAFGSSSYNFDYVLIPASVKNIGSATFYSKLYNTIFIILGHNVIGSLYGDNRLSNRRCSLYWYDDSPELELTEFFSTKHQLIDDYWAAPTVTTSMGKINVKTNAIPYQNSVQRTTLTLRFKVNGSIAHTEQISKSQTYEFTDFYPGDLVTVEYINEDNAVVYAKEIEPYYPSPTLGATIYPTSAYVSYNTGFSSTGSEREKIEKLIITYNNETGENVISINPEEFNGSNYTYLACSSMLTNLAPGKQYDITCSLQYKNGYVNTISKKFTAPSVVATAYPDITMADIKLSCSAEPEDAWYGYQYWDSSKPTTMAITPVLYLDEKPYTDYTQSDYSSAQYGWLQINGLNSGQTYNAQVYINDGDKSYPCSPVEFTTKAFEVTYNETIGQTTYSVNPTLDLCGQTLKSITYSDGESNGKTHMSWNNLEIFSYYKYTYVVETEEGSKVQYERSFSTRGLNPRINTKLYATAILVELIHDEPEKDAEITYVIQYSPPETVYKTLNSPVIDNLQPNTKVRIRYSFNVNGSYEKRNEEIYVTTSSVKRNLFR